MFLTDNPWLIVACGTVGTLLLWKALDDFGDFHDRIEWEHSPWLEEWAYADEHRGWHIGCFAAVVFMLGMILLVSLGYYPP